MHIQILQAEVYALPAHSSEGQEHGEYMMKFVQFLIFWTVLEK